MAAGYAGRDRPLLSHLRPDPCLSIVTHLVTRLWPAATATRIMPVRATRPPVNNVRTGFLYKTVREDRSMFVPTPTLFSVRVFTPSVLAVLFPPDPPRQQVPSQFSGDPKPLRRRHAGGLPDREGGEVWKDIQAVATRWQALRAPPRVSPELKLVHCHLCHRHGTCHPSSHCQVIRHPVCRRPALLWSGPPPGPPRQDGLDGCTDAGGSGGGLLG